MFEVKRGNGYIGKKMSVNAYDAYINGEMPLSKWTKGVILDALSEISDVDFGKLTKKELERFLIQKSYHHTGALYNVTLFYKINEEFVKDFTAEDIEKTISKRAKRVKKSDEQKSSELRAKIEKAFQRQANKNGQNPYYINGKMLKDLELSEIANRTDLLKSIEGDYIFYKGNLKTLRGYTSMRLR
jgi:hypothetical protein